MLLTRKGGASVAALGGSNLPLARSQPRKEDPAFKQGIERLAKLGPSKKDVVYNFFATLAIFQSRSETWQQWNPRLRDQLTASQVANGPEAGSWFTAEDVDAAGGGRLFQTGLSLMCLEVYYRHLPIYRPEAN